MCFDKMAALKGAVTLVTGGGSGLGRAVVERFIREGSKVILCDLPNSEGAFVAKNLGSDCVFCPTDVTSEEDVEKALEITKSKFGFLQNVVNCAGIGIAETVYNVKKGVPHDYDRFMKVLQVNVGGTFNVVRLSVKLMNENDILKRGERGSIINTSSIAAFEGQKGQVAYAASKGGIVSMTLPMARDLSAIGIRVNSIAPGLFDTPLLASLPDKVKDILAQTVPFPKRLGKPEEFAQLAQTIIEQPMMNGETIRLDGALRMAQ